MDIEQVLNRKREGIFYSYNSLFSSLKDDELTMLEDNKTKVRYSKGENIIKQGENITHVVFVYSGILKNQVSYQDKDCITNLIPSGSFAGLPAMLSNKYHVFSLTALDDSIIYYIDIDVVKSILLQNSNFFIELIKESFQWADFLQNKEFTHTHNNIYGKVANTLIYLGEQVFKKDSFNVLVSRKDLAQFAGMSRENFIKVLTEFKRLGIIDVKGKVIDILNYEKLYQILQNGSI